MSPRVVVPLYRLAFGALVLVAIIVQMVSLAQSGVLDPLHYLTFFTNLSNEIAAIVFLVGAARWQSKRSPTGSSIRPLSAWRSSRECSGWASQQRGLRTS